MITFRSFDKYDWMAFSGCESKTPLIAYFGNKDGFLIIVDGSQVDIYGEVEEDSPYRDWWYKSFESDVHALEAAKLLASLFETNTIERWLQIVTLAFGDSETA